MTKRLVLFLGVLLLAVPASAVVFEDFETDAGNDGTNGINGIATSRWSTIDGAWQRETYEGSPAARSRFLAETAIGNLESVSIPLGSDNALRLEHAGFHGGANGASFALSSTLVQRIKTGSKSGAPTQTGLSVPSR